MITISKTNIAQVVLALAVTLSLQCCATYSFADGNDNYDLNLQQFPITYNYLRSTAIAPFYFTRTDWSRVGIVALGAGILYTQDTHIRNYSQENRTAASDIVPRFFTHFGDGSYPIVILALLYLYGEFNDDETYQRAGMLCAETMIVNSIFTGAIKLTLQRPLPNTGLSYDTWYPGPRSVEDLAFPSGHTSTAFAFSTIIATEFSDTPAIPVIAYTAASLTAISMVALDEHWASDLIPGAALGYYTAREIESLQKHTPALAYRKASYFAFFPMVSGNNVSVLCVYDF